MTAPTLRSPAPPRPRRPTSDRILDAALAQFGRRGYEATSLDALAAELGLTKQAILYWFPSKEALLDAVVVRSAEDLRVALEGTLAGTAPGFGRVETVMATVFRFAVRGMVEAAEEALASAGASAAEIDWFIPHQANQRIIDVAARKLGIPRERVVSSVDRHANTSAASIPLALDEAVRDGRIRSGQQVLLVGVGGGFTWGSALIRWA